MNALLKKHKHTTFSIRDFSLSVKQVIFFPHDDATFMRQNLKTIQGIQKIDLQEH